MALVIATLKEELENAYKANVPNATEEQTTQIAAMATAISTAVNNYLLSATITGTCATPSGAGTILGTIS